MNNILIFVPVYNCEKQIVRVINQLEREWVLNLNVKVIIVDNQSTDNTANVVLDRIRQRDDRYIQLLINDVNYGLGGSHKVAFQYASQNNFKWLVVMHGDDQGSIDDFRLELNNLSETDADCILGSRFMRGSNVKGYSKFRIFGNLIFNIIYSLCLRSFIFDLGSGLNIYRVSAMKKDQYIKFPDNLTFNCVMLASNVINNDKVVFVPISWREEDQVSNVKLFRQSLQTLRIALRALFRRNKFVNSEHRRDNVLSYSWRVRNDQ
jgi:glycosyltransferase involved in cell wall biosynthesis